MNRGAKPPETTSQLAAAYDAWYSQWAASDVDEALFPWQHAALQVAADAFRDVSVVDIGCGVGRLTRELVRRGARDVVGVDISEAALCIARQRTAEGPFNARFEWADAQSLPWSDESFDVAFCCETIEHVLDPVTVLTEARRVLVLGGVLILTTPNYLGALGIRRMGYRLVGRPYSEGGQPVNNLTTWPRTRWWLWRAGFAVETVRLTGQSTPGERADHVSSLMSPRLRPLRPLAVFRAVNRGA
jgi:SAM-dependent methyltransferase